jgi:hypothetical protein
MSTEFRRTAGHRTAVIIQQMPRFVAILLIAIAALGSLPSAWAVGTASRAAAVASHRSFDVASRCCCCGDATDVSAEPPATGDVCACCESEAIASAARTVIDESCPCPACPSAPSRGATGSPTGAVTPAALTRAAGRLIAIGDRTGDRDSRDYPTASASLQSALLRRVAMTPRVFAVDPERGCDSGTGQSVRSRLCVWVV